MKVIGLTGGIASGKSTVTEYLRELGAVIIDADILARKIVEPGQPAWKEIIEYFGPEVMGGDGQIDRVRLGQMVFSDAKKREALNRMTHPRVIEKTRELLEEARARDPEAVVVVVAPLLIEAGMVPLVNEVWLVTLDTEAQLNRLMRRDELDRSQAQGRVASQMSLSEKRKYAAKIIDNQGSPEETRAQVDKYWTALKNGSE